MNAKEKKIQIALGTYLPTVWKERNRLRTEGDKLDTEGTKLYSEGKKLYSEREKLYEEGDKLYIEGDRLHEEGERLYIDAVTEVHGPRASIDWDTGKVTMGRRGV